MEKKWKMIFAYSLQLISLLASISFVLLAFSLDTSITDNMANWAMAMFGGISASIFVINKKKGDK